MRPLPTEIRKLIVFVVAIAIAAYAIYGLIADVAPWRLRHHEALHLRGMWAIGGAACVLLGAAGFAILSYGVIDTKPRADSRARFCLRLATPMISIGVAFFLGISFFAEWFVR
ncbi:hypothetical protein [Rhizobiales bacterium 3FA27D7]|jgi:hypothetical protein|uniref:hypothetical protein n=1 Tax=Mesorhizobium sp. 2RAF21 TaxID=3232995 RepID=UPI0010F62EED